MQFTDEWLVPTLEPMLPPDGLAAIRQEVTPAPGSLWETAVQRKLIRDAQVLSAIAGRVRFPVADMGRIDPKAVQSVPEQIARQAANFDFVLDPTSPAVGTGARITSVRNLLKL